MTVDPKNVLLAALSLFTIFYLWRFGFALRGEKQASALGDTVTPTAPLLATGFITNLLDTWGIGSFATTTAIYRQWKMVRDEWIPGTLNVGHTLPAITQAFLFTKLVPVDARTLILMIGAAVSGSYLGAGVVSRWPRRWIQVGMGFALLAAATLMLLAQLKLVPAGADMLELTGTRLYIGVSVNFLLGALMTLGIGLYGPCMILVSLLGMNPTAAFPIMMGSCAFLMPIASARFIKARRYDPRAALSLLIGGVPAVLIAVYIITNLSMTYVRIGVIVVVVYTAFGLLRTAMKESRAAGEAAA
jgi:uncharacterized membrane protein YfcA